MVMMKKQTGCGFRVNLGNSDSEESGDCRERRYAGTKGNFSRF